MTTCASLADFCDGELDTPETYAFREHLQLCEACQAGVVEHLQLCARLRDLRPTIETQPVRVPAETRKGD